MRKLRQWPHSVAACFFSAAVATAFGGEPAGSDLTLDDESGTVAGVVGPDIIISRIELNSSENPTGYGSVGGISAFAIGTTSCNIGNVSAEWERTTPRHPVIAQNMYRLKGGRFEQIGMSWVKHGFLATNENEVGCGPCDHPGFGDLLGPGCADTYVISLNGQHIYLGPRWPINAFTGQFPYPVSAPAPAPVIGRRLQVHNTDLDSAMNAGALYFGEGHYVTADDAAAGNGLNNLSYRQIVVSFRSSDGSYLISRTGPNKVQDPAIRAWREREPTVIETDVQVPAEGLFILAAKTTELGTGFWHYEYAVFNLNSDRSARSFSVPIPDGSVVLNVGFHDVDYHSGDPYDPTDWPGIVADDRIIWQTDSYDVSPNANALRWGTLYNFRFDTNVPPTAAVVTLGLFKPGQPEFVTATSTGPMLGFIDCNRNTLADVCDVDCGVTGGTCDRAGCGQSADCNSNLVPDECEVDCNENTVPDSCDISSGTSHDCNENTVPDDCEPDCDGDGLPDQCDGSDLDEDGVIDCDDRCPATTPPKGCLCPSVGLCCFCDQFELEECFLPGNELCFVQDYPVRDCLLGGGRPECETSPCLEGCLYSDGDADGDRDLADFAMLQNCFSGSLTDPAYEPPPEECRPFDVNHDSDVDLPDFGDYLSALNAGG